MGTGCNWPKTTSIVVFGAGRVEFPDSTTTDLDFVPVLGTTINAITMPLTVYFHPLHQPASVVDEILIKILHLLDYMQ